MQIELRKYQTTYLVLSFFDLALSPSRKANASEKELHTQHRGAETGQSRPSAVTALASWSQGIEGAETLFSERVTPTVWCYTKYPEDIAGSTESQLWETDGKEHFRK